jgi:hypothetical protein
MKKVYGIYSPHVEFFSPPYLNDKTEPSRPIPNRFAASMLCDMEKGAPEMVQWR